MFAEQTTQRAIGLVVVALVAIGGVFFVWWTVYRGRKEIGSEIELAPNRSADLDDATLEGKRLNVALWFSLGMLVLIAIMLPLYWMAEPGRQEGAEKSYNELFIRRGLEIYVNGAQCQSCHGPNGTGGVKDYIINDEDGQFLSKVNWAAPALDNILYRFSQAEVKDILTYGRPGTPMPAWGTEGGGPLTSQQLDDVIAYLWSVQLKPADMTTQVDNGIKAVDEALYNRLVAVRDKNRADPRLDPSSDQYDAAVYSCPETVGAKAGEESFACLSTADNLRLGEILFNFESVASGAYGCSRCHVPGAPYGKPWQPVTEIGTGRFAPNLIGIEEDLTAKQHFALIVKGTEYGRQYGTNHQGSGRMPGFASNANDGNLDVPQLGKAGMLGPEEAWAIMVYERNLSKERPDLIAQGLNPGDVKAGATDPNAVPVTAALPPTTTTTAPAAGRTTTTVGK